jgi:hypothetical protein
MSPDSPVFEPGATAASGRSLAAAAEGGSRADARQWQHYLNRGLAANARAETPTGPGEASGRAGQALPGEGAPAPATAAGLLAASAPPRASGAGAPLPGLAPGGGPSGRLPTAAPLAAMPPGEFLPKGAEALSQGLSGNALLASQVAYSQSQANPLSHAGMGAALPAGMMIADLSAARFSSLDTTPPAAASNGSGNASSGKGSSAWSDPAPRPEWGELRPMRWLLPWLWQLSQTPVEEGEPIEWEVELPEGDRLRLHAVRHYGEWILDFAGSSARLQRWLGQHHDELAARLQRIIGKPVRLFLDPSRSLPTAS